MPEVIFNGPAGRIEGRYHHNKAPNSPVAIILHPHPQFGGTMNNPIVHQLYYAFVGRNFSVLRFNFRGVGRSQGRYDQGQGELSDAASALDWLQAYNPDARACWIAGFSFGAWIALQLLMRRPEINGFIAVAPPARIYDFSFLAPCPVSGQVIQGTSDEIVSVEEVRKLVHKLSSQRDVEVDFRVIDGADHFFNGHLEKVAAAVQDYVTDRLKLIGADGD